MNRLLIASIAWLVLLLVVGLLTVPKVIGFIMSVLAGSGLLLSAVGAIAVILSFIAERFDL